MCTDVHAKVHQDSATAIAMLAMLKMTWIGLGRDVVCQTVCAIVARLARSTVLANESCIAPSRTKRKMTEIVPVTPGSRTFKLHATTARPIYSRVRHGSLKCQWKM